MDEWQWPSGRRLGLIVPGSIPCRGGPNAVTLGKAHLRVRGRSCSQDSLDRMRFESGEIAPVGPPAERRNGCKNGAG